MKAKKAVAVASAVLVLAACGDRPRSAAPTSSTSSRTTSTSTSSTTSTSTTTSTTTTRVASTTATTVAPTPAAAIRRGNPNRPVVALTFDAGSDVGNTAPILDVLARNGVRATFGVTGRFAEAHSDLVKRMAAEGHQLVNHSYDHPSFPDLTRAQRLDQLARAEAAIQAAAGTGAKPWFRPPFGAEDASVRADIARAGYRYELMWTSTHSGGKAFRSTRSCLAASTARCRARSS